MNRPRQTCDSLGAFVTGSLSAAERAEMERHVRSCDACQHELVRLAPLPALLRRLPPPDVEASDPVAGSSPGDQADRRLVAGVRRLRRRRRARWAAVVAAAAAELVGASVGVAQSASSPPARVLSLKGVGAHGEAELQARAWGTQIILRVQGLPRGAVLTAMVTGPDGTYTVGSWRTPAGGDAVVDLATAVTPRAVRHLVVTRAATGHPILGS